MRNKILGILLGLCMVFYGKTQEIELKNSNWNRNGPFSAYGKSLAMAPSNPDVLYLGTFASGVYKTTNSGETWTYCSTVNLPVYKDTLNNSPSVPCWWFGDYYPIEAIAVSPNDEDRLWISTLERGLFESTNGGESWKKANTTLPDTLAVNLIHINPQNPNDILIGTGKYFTVGSPSNGGLYRTLDGGNTWFLIEDLPHENSYYISDIIRDPTNNDHIVVSISSAGEPDFTSGLMESFDNGTTWQELSVNIFDFKNVSINPINNQNLWSVVLTGYQDYLLMNSFDGGQNWNLYQGFEDPYKWVGSLYADKDFNLYIDRENCESAFYSVLKSNDNGTTWFEVDTLSNKSGNDLTNRCQAEPSNTDNIYFGSLHGVYHSVDGGTTTRLDNSGLMNSYINELEIHPKNSDIIYAGGKQGLWKSFDGGQNWQQIMDQSIMHIKYDNTHPDTLYIGGSFKLYRSYNDGKTFKSIYNGISGGISDIAINPITTNIVYAASAIDDNVHFLYKSADYGNTWQRLLISEHGGLTIDNRCPDTLYFYHHRSTDGGITWVENVMETRIIAVHPDDSHILYGSSGNNISVSYNWGISFNVIAQYFNGPLVSNNIRKFTISEYNPDYLFYCTLNDGAYYSIDAGNTWQKLEGEYDNRTLEIIPLINRNKFYIATHGDGVWVYDTVNINAIYQNNLQKKRCLNITPNPFKNKTTIEYYVEKASDISIFIYNLKGELIAVLLNEQKKAKGMYNTIWNGKGLNGKEVKPGLYLVRLNSGRNSYTSKVVLLK